MRSRLADKDRRLSAAREANASLRAGSYLVHDGAGIAPENVRRVFEPFFSTRGVGKGIGLGLTAAWGIVSRFGGRIDVQSTPGRGAAFTIRLPVAREEERDGSQP